MSPLLQEYLKSCGVSRRTIARCNEQTRLYHDLGIYGDIAEVCMEVLVDNYGVDLTGFDFATFFPPEFPGKNMFTSFFLTSIPFMGAIQRRNMKQHYKPLTLDMIAKLIQEKRWSALQA